MTLLLNSFLIFTLLIVFLTTFRLYVHYSYGEQLRDNCACSDSWEKDVLQYGPFFTLFIAIIFTNSAITNKKSKLYAKYLFRIFSFLLSGIYLSYIYKLIQIECVCSDDWKRTFITIYEIFIIVVQLIAMYYFGKY